MANRKEKTQLSKLKDKSQTGKKNTFYHDLDNRSVYCKKKKKKNSYQYRKINRNMSKGHKEVTRKNEMQMDNSYMSKCLPSSN